jgi:hypothetical protein
MAIKRDTEFAVRAKDLASKPLGDVAKAIEQISETLDRQIESARRGEVSVKELQDSYKQLEQAGKALVSQAGLTEEFERLSAQLTENKAKAASLATQYATMKAAQESATKVTKAEERALASLAKSQESAQAAIQRTETSLAAVTTQLEAVGIATTNLAEADRIIAQSATQVGASLTAAKGAIESYNIELRTTKAAEAALATDGAFQKKLAEAAQLRTASEYVRFFSGSLTELSAHEREIVATNVFERELAEARKSQQAAQYVSELTAALEQQEIQQRKNAALATFRQQATVNVTPVAAGLDQYEARVRAAAVATSNLAGELRAAVNPAAAAFQTIAGLDAEVERFAKSLPTAQSRVSEMQASLAELGRIQSAVIEVAGRVDAFKNQASAVGAAEAAYNSAQAELTRYKQAVLNAAEPNDALAVGLRNAEGAAAGATQTLEHEREKLAQLSVVLEQAGVDVNNLAAAETHLKAISTSSIASAAKLQTVMSGQGHKLGGILGLKPYELQNLGFQINDVFTQLASGASIEQTLAQQGGQLLQIFPGIFKVIVQRIPEIALAVAVFGSLAAAIGRVNETAAGVREFKSALDINIDGTMFDPKLLEDNAHQLQNYGAKIKDARTELKEFIAAGVDPSKLVQFGAASQDLADAIGIKLPEAAKKLAEGFTNGYDGVKKLDEAYNFLEPDQRRAIKTLYDQGRGADAAGLAFDIFSGKVGKAAADARGPWTEAARGLTTTWRNFLDALADTGVVTAMTGALNLLAGALRLVTGAVNGPSIQKQIEGLDATALGKRRAELDAAKKEQEQFLNSGSLSAEVGGATISNIARLEKQIALIDEQTAALKAQTKVRQEGSGQEKKIAEDIVDGLKEQRAEALKATDAESRRQRLQLAGDKAVRAAEKEGVKATPLLESIRAEARTTEQGKIQKELDALQRSADAKARAAENKRSADVRSLLSQEDALKAQVLSADRTALGQQLDAIDAKYASIFETIRKAKKDGVTTLTDANGVKRTVAQFSKDIAAETDKLKVIEKQKVFQEQIAKLRATGVDQVREIEQAQTDGLLSASEAFDQIKGKQDELNKQVVDTAQAAIVFAQAIGGANPSPQLQAFLAQMQATLSHAQSNGPASDTGKAGKEIAATQFAKVNELISARNDLLAVAQTRFDRAEISEGQLEAARQQAFAQFQPQLTAAINETERLIDKIAQSGGATAEQLAAWRAQLQGIATDAVYVDGRFTMLREGIENAFGQALVTAINSAATAFGNLIAGTESFGEAIADIGRAALQFVADFLKGIAETILQLYVLQAIKNSGAFGNLASGILDVAGITTAAAALAAPATALNTAGIALTTAGGALGPSAVGLNTGGDVLLAAGGLWVTILPGLLEAANALAYAASLLIAAEVVAVAHSGAIVGAPGGRSRGGVSPLMFAGAPRFHRGGFPGLAPNERPIIAKVGEEVLSPNDPRNALNGGKGYGRGGGQGGDLTQLLVLDQESLARAMASSAGKKVIVTMINDMIPSIRQKVAGR